MHNNTDLKNEITRGTVVFVKNRQANGHVMMGNHPAVIIQNNKGNMFSPLIIVCYLSSQIKRLEMKTHVLLQHYDNLKTTVVQAEQIATINKTDILSIVTKLRPEDMIRVDTAIKVSLGLEAS
ncbi:type II toxin-antitoxin system PemK/MazF family toxin [Eubacteriaceae bacterium ES3]|nr:type II toxin-antitoxin system PemK/MazF family toxin [Eubacteriaceae bacterium ES3]